MSAWKRQLAIAGATVGIVSVLSNSAMPGRSMLDPQARQQELHRQWAESEKETLRRRPRAGDRLGDAVARDNLRPREVRPAERAADDVARLLLRRLP